MHNNNHILQISRLKLTLEKSYKIPVFDSSHIYIPFLHVKAAFLQRLA